MERTSRSLHLGAPQDRPGGPEGSYQPSSCDSPSLVVSSLTLELGALALEVGVPQINLCICLSIHSCGRQTFSGPSQNENPHQRSTAGPATFGDFHVADVYTDAPGQFSQWLSWSLAGSVQGV